MSSSSAPRTPLPSLNALYAFDAAARHLSFTQAARELGVTQTAVSHQVRTLEHELGCALFRRGPQRVALTPEGQAWAVELAAVFGRLREVNQRLRQTSASARPAVSVSIIPSFGSRWLVPRLGAFLRAHPELDVRISATEHLVDFANEPVDLGIRYGQGGYPGLVAEKLAEDALVVVAAPSLVPGRLPLRELRRQVLLHDDFQDGWARWFAARGHALPDTVARTELTDSSMLVEAALRGQGVALARWSLVVDELAAHRLRLPFPDAVPIRTGLAYFLVGTRAGLRRPPVAAFRDWVRAEARGLALPG